MRSSIGKCGTSIKNDPSFSSWMGSSLSIEANKDQQNSTENPQQSTLIGRTISEAAFSAW